LVDSHQVAKRFGSKTAFHLIEIYYRFGYGQRMKAQQFYTLVLLFFAISTTIGQAATLEILCVQPSLQAKKPEEPDTGEFHLLTIGNARREDGFWTETLTLVCTSGQKVYKTTIQFKTKEQAEGELERLSKQAVKVIRRSTEIDKLGKPVGERVLAQFGEKERIGTRVRLFYTKYSAYYELESDSLDVVLALEKRIVKMSE
jgi:hypothetical protein